MKSLFKAILILSLIGAAAYGIYKLYTNYINKSVEDAEEFDYLEEQVEENFAE